MAIYRAGTHQPPHLTVTLGACFTPKMQVLAFVHQFCLTKPVEMAVAAAEVTTRMKTCEFRYKTSRGASVKVHSVTLIGPEQKMAWQEPELMSRIYELENKNYTLSEEHSLINQKLDDAYRQ